MEFNEKLQELRKQKGLTQEELAEILYVSRTAVSKWESGRGYPNIDSLKAISKFFSVTIDELLSGDEMISVAEEEGRQKEQGIRNLVLGILDCSAAMLFFLPFFGEKIGEAIYEVSLLNLTAVSQYLKFLYFIAVVLIILCGIGTLALQNFCNIYWDKIKSKISLILNIFCVLLFIISQQPYAAVLMFVFLMIKILSFIKWH